MMLLGEGIQEKLIDLLLGEGLVSLDSLNYAKASAMSSGRSIATTLVENGVVDDELITHAVAQVSGVPYVNLTNVVIKRPVLDLLPLEIARKLMAVPIAQAQGRLAVAMIDAHNIQSVDMLSAKLGKPLKVYMASEAGINHILDQYIDKGVDHDNITAKLNDSPSSKAINAILEYAVKSHASGVYIEPLQDNLKIRFRVDGMLRDVADLPKDTESSLIGHIKILANLQIDEHRLPQSGQFTAKIAGSDINLDVSITPIIWGEQVSIGLPGAMSMLGVEQIGCVGRALMAMRKAISSKGGVVVVSGPTDSGKTTSLYSLITESKGDSVNIVTLEDPVKLKIDGIGQIQVDARNGLTFASGLRSILNQDSDVVMVSDVRDGEVANLAFQAATGGRLVLCAMNTNSAVGVLRKLLDMGLEPFSVANTTRAIINQRLLRCVGQNRETYQSNPIETEDILRTVGHLLPKTSSDVARVSELLGYSDLPLADQKSYTLVKGVDSPQTPNGYSGRTGVYEVIDIDGNIQKLVISGASMPDIQKQAQVNGMVTMRQDGYLKALQGVTTIAEVNRVISDREGN